MVVLVPGFVAVTKQLQELPVYLSSQSIMVGKKWQLWKPEVSAHFVFTVRKQRETSAATQLALPVSCSLAHGMRLPTVIVGLPAAAAGAT